MYGDAIEEWLKTKMENGEWLEIWCNLCVQELEMESGFGPSSS